MADETFWVLFGSYPACARPPRAVSPVADYVAPNAAASWTALGINGFVQRYNALLAEIDRYIGAGSESAYTVDHSKVATAADRELAQATLKWVDVHGKQAVLDYNAAVKASRDALAAACAELNVPLPRHGATPGMKCVVCPGILMP